MPHRIRTIDLAPDRHPVLARPWQLRRREDVEHAPASAPILLMTSSAMLEGADAAARAPRPPPPADGRAEGGIAEPRFRDPVCDPLNPTVR